MSVPFIRIWPVVGMMKPAMSRSMVVLPQPEGPSSVKNSPSLMYRFTWSKARSPSYSLETSLSSINLLPMICSSRFS